MDTMNNCTHVSGLFEILRSLVDDTEIPKTRNSIILKTHKIEITSATHFENIDTNSPTNGLTECNNLTLGITHMFINDCSCIKLKFKIIFKKTHSNYLLNDVHNFQNLQLFLDW